MCLQRLAKRFATDSVSLHDKRPLDTELLLNMFHKFLQTGAFSNLTTHYTIQSSTLLCSLSSCQRDVMLRTKPNIIWKTINQMHVNKSDDCESSASA